jgi:hypothetical protein
LKQTIAIAVFAILFCIVLVGTAFGATTNTSATTNTTSNSFINNNSISSALSKSGGSVNAGEASILFKQIIDPINNFITILSFIIFAITLFVGELKLYNDQVKEQQEKNINIDTGIYLKFAVFASLILLIPAMLAAFTIAFPSFITATQSSFAAFTFSGTLITAILVITVIFAIVGFILFIKILFEEIFNYFNNKNATFSSRRLFYMFVIIVAAPFLISFVFLFSTQVLITFSSAVTTNYSNVSVSTSPIVIAVGTHAASVQACPVQPSFWQLGQESICVAESTLALALGNIYPFAVQANLYNFISSMLVHKFLANTFTIDIYNILFPIILIWTFGWLDYLLYKYFSDMNDEKKETTFRQLKAKFIQYGLFIFSPVIFIILLLIISIFSQIIIGLMFTGNFTPIPALLTITSPFTTTNPIVLITGIIGLFFVLILLVVVGLFSIMEIIAGPLFVTGTYLFASDKPTTKLFGKRIYYLVIGLFILPLFIVFIYSMWFGILPGILSPALMGNATVTTGNVYGFTLAGSGHMLSINGPGLSISNLDCASNPSVNNALQTISQANTNQPNAYSALSYGCKNFIIGAISGVQVIDAITILLVIFAIFIAPQLSAAVPGLGGVSTAITSLQSGKGILETSKTIGNSVVESFTNSKGSARKLISGTYGFVKAPLTGTTEGALLEGVVGTATATVTGLGEGINKTWKEHQEKKNKEKAKKKAAQDALEYDVLAVAGELQNKNKKGTSGLITQGQLIDDLNSGKYKNAINEDGSIDEEILKNDIKESINLRRKQAPGKLDSIFEKAFGKDDFDFKSNIDTGETLRQRMMEVYIKNPDLMKDRNKYQATDVVNAIKTYTSDEKSFLAMNTELSNINRKYKDDVKVIQNSKMKSTEKSKALLEIENDKNIKTATVIKERTESLSSSLNNIQEKLPGMEKQLTTVTGSKTPGEMIANLNKMLTSVNTTTEQLDKTKMPQAEKETTQSNLKNILSVLNNEAEQYGFKNINDLVTNGKSLSSVRLSDIFTKIKSSASEEEKQTAFIQTESLLKQFGLDGKKVDNVMSFIKTNPDSIEALQKTLFANLNGTSKQIGDLISNSITSMTNPVLSSMIEIPNIIGGSIHENLKTMITNPINQTLKTNIDAIKKMVNETWYQVSTGSTDTILERIGKDNSLLSSELAKASVEINKYQEELLKENLPENEKMKIQEKVEILKTDIKKKKMEILSNNKAVTIYSKIPVLSGLMDAVVEFNVMSTDDVVKQYKFRRSFIENQESTITKEATNIYKQIDEYNKKLAATKDASIKAYLDDQITRNKEKLAKLQKDNNVFKLQKIAIDNFLDTANIELNDAEVNDEMLRLNIANDLNNKIEELASDNKNNEIKTYINNYDNLVEKLKKTRELKMLLSQNKPINTDEYKNILQGKAAIINAAIQKKTTEAIDSEFERFIAKANLNTYVSDLYSTKNQLTTINEDLKELQTKYLKESNITARNDLQTQIATLMSNKNSYTNMAENIKKNIKTALSPIIPQEDIQDIVENIASVNTDSTNSEALNKTINSVLKENIEDYIQMAQETKVNKMVNAIINGIETKYDKTLSNETNKFAVLLQRNIKEILNKDSNDVEINKEKHEIYERIKDMPYSNKEEITSMLNKIEMLGENGNVFAVTLLQSLDNITTKMKENRQYNLSAILENGIAVEKEELAHNIKAIQDFKTRVAEFNKVTPKLPVKSERRTSVRLNSNPKKSIGPLKNKKASFNPSVSKQENQNDDTAPKENKPTPDDDITQDDDIFD